MLFQDTRLVIVGAVLSAAALVLGANLAVEVVRVTRDFFAALRGGTPSGEQSAQDRIEAAHRAAQRNRAAVKRMITRFQEGDSDSGPPS